MNRFLRVFLPLWLSTVPGFGQRWQVAADSAGLYLDRLLYHQALPHAERAVAAWPPDQQRDTAYARCLGHLAEAEIYAHRPDSAFQHAQRALQAWEYASGTQTLAYARALQRRAGALQELERFAEAEADHTQALTLTARLMSSRSTAYAATLGRSGVLYRMMGLRAKAQNRLTEALGLFEALGQENHLDYAVATKHLAESSLFIGPLNHTQIDYAAAQRMLYNSLHTLTVLGCRESIVGAEALRSLATANLFEFRDTGRFSEAPDSLVRVALAILRKTAGEDSPNYSSCLSGLSVCLEYLGQHGRATEVQEQVYQRVTRLLPPTHTDLTAAASSLCRAYARQGRYTEAGPLARLVSQNLLRELRMFTASLGDSERERVHANVINNFEAFHTLARLFATRNPAISAEEYNNQLAIKGFLLQAGQAHRQRLLSRGDTAVQTLHARWLASRETLAQANRLSRAELAAQGLRIDSIEASVNAIDETLARRVGAAVDAPAATWRDVQRTLRPGEAALELIRYRGNTFARRIEFTDTVRYVALVVTPDCTYPQAVLLENGNELEGPMLRAYQSDVQRQTHLAGSYAQYWAPIKAALRGVKRLYFSPDGVYQGLNVQTLRNPVTGQYVFDEMDVVLLTSSRELVQKPVKRTTGPAVLLGAPHFEELPGERLSVHAPRRGSATRLSRDNRYQDLPGARREVEAIAALLHDRMPVRVFTNERAREETLKTVTAPRLLHVATHGFLETDSSMGQSHSDPLLRSGLVLAGANRSLRDLGQGGIFGENRRDDGLLTAYEAANLDLTGTDLVVLSACQSGLGEQPRSGEGVYGLQRAFRVAGAGALLMSLWKVDDEATRLLMITFYRHWLQTGDKARAFRLAQQAVRQEYPEPFYWGAFVLVGR